MALGYCYRQGLIHRDVKPANLLVTLDGDRIDDIKVTDFGSVFNLGSDHTQIYRVGSLAYMSPEQLDGNTLDCRADMYSLAAVLYHLVAGRPPFDAMQQQALMHQIYHATPPPLAGLREGVPPALQSLIESCLAQGPRASARPTGTTSPTRCPRSAPTAWCGAGRCRRCWTPSASRCCARWSSSPTSATSNCGRWCTARSGSATPTAQALYRKGEAGNTFHIVTQGQVEVYRDGRQVASWAPAPRWARWPTWRPAPSCACTPWTSWSRSRPPRCRSRPHAWSSSRWPRATSSTRPSSACWCAGCTPRTRRGAPAADPVMPALGTAAVGRDTTVSRYDPAAEALLQSAPAMRAIP